MTNDELEQREDELLIKLSDIKENVRYRVLSWFEEKQELLRNCKGRFIGYSDHDYQVIHGRWQGRRLWALSHRTINADGDPGPGENFGGWSIDICKTFLAEIDSVHETLLSILELMIYDLEAEFQ
jgi:hypothetical protein